MENVALFKQPGNPETLSSLEQRFRNKILQSNDPVQVEQILDEINQSSKTYPNDTEEKKLIKRLRQRAYDRKRVLLQTDRNPQSFLPTKEEPKETTKIATNVTTRVTHPRSFREGIYAGLQQIDGEKLILALPKVLLLILATSLVVGLFWMQSVQLYEASGFEEAKLIAAGGLFMVAGFAAFRACSNSWLAILLCFYAGAYETYFVVSGTLSDEKQSQEQRISEDPSFVFLKEQSEKQYTDYLLAKNRYNDPNSKVYKNEWFKKKYLDPAWNQYQQAQNALSQQVQGIAKETFHHTTWLKVLYRLGLVILVMILVHGLASLFCLSPKPRENAL